MACAVDARRRLLLSIIRAPSLSHQRTPAQFQPPLRSFHNTRSQYNDGFSITFGPRIDGLLGSKKTKSRSSDKTKSKKKILNKGSVGGNTIALEADKITSTGFSASTTVYESYDRNEMYPNSSDIDGTVTLELSGDAYDAISRPEDSDVADRAHAETVASEIAVGKHRSGTGLGGRTGAVSTGARQAKAPVRRTHENANEPAKTRALLNQKEAQSLQKRSPQELRRKLESWQVQKNALEKKFGETGWNPRKKVSPDALDGIRNLHEQDPERYTTEFLANQFKMSPEAIRRILKSKWRPSAEKMEERRQRWARRHDRIWDRQAALGLRPSRTEDREPEGPEAFEEEVRAKQALGQL